jgi:hypothetical protein
MESQQQLDFNEAIKPLLQHLNKYHHPHTKVIVDCNTAEVLE